MDYFKTVISYCITNDDGKIKKMTKQIITDSEDFEHVQQDVIREFDRIYKGDNLRNPHDFNIKSISKVEFDYVFDKDKQDDHENGGWYKVIVRFPENNEKMSVLISGDNNVTNISESVTKHIQQEVVFDFEIVQITSTNILSVAIS